MKNTTKIITMISFAHFMRVQRRYFMFRVGHDKAKLADLIAREGDSFRTRMNARHIIGL